MAQIKEEIELKIAELQMDYYMKDNNFANVNDYVKAELEKGVELSNGAEIRVDSSGKLSYEGLEIGTLNPDGSVTIDGELSGNQIVSKYAVSYNANGGQGGPSSKKYAAGESVSVDFTTKPTKKGANFLGWATSSTATTPEYTSSGNFTMGSQSVTLYAVWETLLGSAAIKPEYYGDKVNYSANGVNDWKVFLNDGNSVYLISSDYVPNSGITNALNKLGNYAIYGNSRDELVSALTNTSNWSAYATGFSGAIATGSPTLQQFWASYNGVYGINYSEEHIDLSDQTGYNDILYFPHKESWNNINGYWFSSPNTTYQDMVEDMSYRGHVNYAVAGYSQNAVRPLVRLPANAKMNWNGTAWDLSN